MNSDDSTSNKLTPPSGVTSRHVQSNEQLLATILDHTHMLVAYLDTAFNFVRVNRAYAQADGKSEDFFPGKNHFDLYPNTENQVIFEQVIKTGAPYFAHAKAFEYAECPERGVSYWDWSLVPTHSENGAITGLVLTLTDVTQVVETRESLRRERDLADSLIRTAPAIILRLDKCGKIVSFNPYLEALSGCRLADVVGESWFEAFIPPAERTRIEALFCTAISGVETRGNSNTIVGRNGDVRIIQWSDTTLRDAQGNVSGLLAVGIDNTELLSSQQDLVLFKSIVQSSSEAIAIADDAGRIVFVNQAYEALFGYRAAEVMGQDCVRCCSNAGEVQTRLSELIDAGDCASWEGEVDVIDGRGRAFPVWMRLDCACREDGSGRNFILLAHDITAQKRNEQQRFQEEQRRHEIFIREIHHRIKNHLQGVIGLLHNSVTGTQLEPDVLDELVGKISAMAGVYDISTRHIGPMLPLIEVLRSVIKTVRDQSGSDCCIEFDDGDVSACLNGEEAVPLALVLNELLTNACKHRMPGGSPIKVSLMATDECAVLTILNAGSLPAGFSFETRSGIGMGLSLIHSLLPRDCAELTLEACESVVVACLKIASPLLMRSETGG